MGIIFEFSLMNSLILVSVLICVFISFVSAYIIYIRDLESLEHKFFTLFFIGITGFVGFYTFLQYSHLKDYSYFLQIFFGAVSVFGLFFFYYSIAHKGNIPQYLYILLLICLFFPPVLIILLKPYSFVEQWYGFELIIDPWFMILANVIYPLLMFYSIIGLLRIQQKSGNRPLRSKLKLVIVGLCIMMASDFIFFTSIPIFLEIHYLKPIGYLLVSLGIIIMTYSFTRNNNRDEKV